ncbi:MAG: hypothetical protein GOMPHAMPRED_005006 [Gomphillus americanus]|uniref:WH1 domain-containing protein n=1 Tax=Gomphillus americanus TaxID=1940652 RepID=A0A8H3EN07_9LECA|nr:MAG: hypothetical protein GOMPHAMPRED_005006 [Gomphillus americanus]
MLSILSDADRETVKRTVPKSANKIQAVAVARLYVAHPNRQRWTYTGLQGAAVLANDLIGNTFWIKLVDVSPANRGVIWDQEIYEPFYYNQDRTFFHSFELEDCLAGLSFVDEKEAKTFKKKMDEREKNASKATRNTPFQGVAGSGLSAPIPTEKHHSRLSNLLHGHRPSSTYNQPTQSIIPPRQAPIPVQQPNGHAPSELDAVDPSWRGMLQELMNQGITEDQIAQNAEFIKRYIQEKQSATANTNGTVSDSSFVKSPPPPPAAPPNIHHPISPQNTGSTATSRRGPPPAPPAPRRSRAEVPSAPSPPPQATPPRTPSPPRPKFRAPPPIADAGRFAGPNAPAPPSRSRQTSSAVAPSSGPPPPPRPPKTPENEDHDSKSKWSVPPPFVGERNQTAPVVPTRNTVPAPPPRSRDVISTHAVPPATAIAPPLPPKIPVSGAPSSGPPPPPPPARKEVSPMVPPPPPRTAQTAPTLPPTSNAPPLPPPPPSNHAPPLPPPLPTSSSVPPPPPPPPPSSSSAGPPPPPPPPRGPSGPPLPQSSGVPGDLLASIRNAGGSGTGGLRKVKESEKRDRSAAAVPGSETAASVSSPTTGGAAAGGLAGSLAAALAARNKKVSASDDEDDNDDWD